MSIIIQINSSSKINKKLFNLVSVLHETLIASTKQQHKTTKKYLNIKF